MGRAIREIATDARVSVFPFRSKDVALVPSRVQHITKADGNPAFALLLKLDQQPNIDWALVALFYAAMHYVEALPCSGDSSQEPRDARQIHRQGIPPAEDISRIPASQVFWVQRALEVIGFTAQDVTEAAQDYEKIRAHIAPRL